MYMARISALQLAVVGLTWRPRSAARSRQLPAGWALGQKRRATADELNRRGADIDARLARCRAPGEVETQDRFGARRLLLLFDGADGRRAQLLAGCCSVVPLERGAEALRHRGHVAFPVTATTAGRCRAGEGAHSYDRG